MLTVQIHVHVYTTHSFPTRENLKTHFGEFIRVELHTVIYFFSVHYSDSNPSDQPVFLEAFFPHNINMLHLKP